ncbi:CBM96 family carbohydrate-binding protein [Edaphobacter dinghuensis]|uniref:Carbohydrate-binding module family 96 domain-containing protein n=1 Tax=Edaphobacter dinghuensis TaxID=1560005 RepID=A0A917M874_9BACT|nr:DNRLRE domain-containing protein [Edaphobacter dinghuensis]GGG83624.1 hypothetical protein GCM10011585_29180 [Edaphobacter dinghuensis]
MCILPQSMRRFCYVIVVVMLIHSSFIAYASTPPHFLIYDNTFYPNSQQVFDSAGALRATVMYSQATWPGTCTSTGCPNAPTETQLKQDLTAYVSEFHNSNVIIFDYENLVLSAESSTGAANQAVALFQQLIAWTRQVYPNAKIGMYDYDYSSTYSPNNSSGYNTIRAQLFNGSSSSFDFFAPTLYQRWSTHTAWDQNLAEAIINDSAINQANGLNLPIYPYISPYVNGTYTGTLLAESEWQSELTDLVNCDTPSSSACKTIMTAVTPPSGTCSASGSTTPCTAIGGGILWVGGSSNISATTNWVQDLTGILSPAINTNVTYQIRSVGQTGTCVDIGSNGNPVANPCSPSTTSQIWKFALAGTDGTFTINSYSYQRANPGNNQALDSANGSLGLATVASGGTPSANEEWQVVSLANGYYELVETGDYSTSGNTDSEECLVSGGGGQLSTSICNGGADQEFQLSFVAASGYVVLSDTADAFIQGGADANTNYGTWSYNIVEGATGIYARKAYIKFDLSEITGTITSATLYLVPNIVTWIDTDAIYNVADNTWVQTGITWNNAPAFGTTAINTWSVSPASVGQPLLLDVTSAAVSAQSAGLFSLGIQASGASNYVGYASQRNGTASYRPLLVVSVQ